jgi:CRP-like cAMP-binding protein
VPQSSGQEHYKNRVLASLPPSEIDRLAPHLLSVDLPVNLTLQRPGKTVDYVHFLEDGVCSTVATMGSGTTVEVGMTGRDGFVGLPVVLGTGNSPNRSFMQIAGYGFRVKAQTLIELSDASGPLRSCLLRSVHAMMVQTAQIAACNRVHGLPQRLARRLLMCRDRVRTDQLSITQEILAIMLGTRRSSVTVAAGTLQKAGLITYTRGHVLICNRAGLKGAVCECYKVVRDEFERLGLMEPFSAD